MIEYILSFFKSRKIEDSSGRLNTLRFLLLAGIVVIIIWILSFLFGLMKVAFLSLLAVLFLYMAINNKITGKNFLWYSLVGIILSSWILSKYYTAGFSPPEEVGMIENWYNGGEDIKPVDEQYAQVIAYCNSGAILGLIANIFLPKEIMEDVMNSIKSTFNIK